MSLYIGNKRRCGLLTQPPTILCIPRDVVADILTFLNVVEICSKTVLVSQEFQATSFVALRRLEWVEKDAGWDMSDDRFRGGIVQVLCEYGKSLKDIEDDLFMAFTVKLRDLIFFFFVYNKVMILFCC